MPEFGHDVMVVAGNAPIGYNRANPDKDARSTQKLWLTLHLRGCMTVFVGGGRRGQVTWPL
jgi:hypothetical protein